MNKDSLLALYETFPFEYHPLWQGIFNGELSKGQVLEAEKQHYLRTKAGRDLRIKAAQQAKGLGETIWTNLISTAMEECIDTPSNPSHLELISRLLIDGGITRETLGSLKPTPGNSAAIALYKEISARGSGCHLIGAGAVEHYYSLLCPKIFDAYTKLYGFSCDAAATYQIHGGMDQVHADRAFSVLPQLMEIYGSDQLEESVRDAFVATSLHYDGMLQAAQSKISYWDGVV